MKKWIHLVFAVTLFGLSNLNAIAFAEAGTAAQYIQAKAAAIKLPEADQAMISHEYKKAFDIYSHFAGQNNPVAQYQLAYLYLHGLGVPKDAQLAAAWY